MATGEALLFMPLDLDTFLGSERFMDGSELGKVFNQGIRAYLHAQYREAVECFKAALIAAYVDDGRAILTERERAIIYLYIGNARAYAEEWDAALLEYLEAVNTDPSLTEAHYNLGVAFAAVGQFDRAIAAFKEALEQNEMLYEAHFALGRCYQHLNDSVRAYIHYAAAREVRPHAAEPLYYMGLMHQRHGAHELARRCFAEALRVEPTFVGPEAESADVVELNEGETVAWYYRLSDDLKRQGAEEEAERIYRALLEWKPDEHRARLLLGNLLVRQKRFEDAVREYLQIPQTSTFYVAARLRIAAVLRLNRHLKQAYAVLYECARQYPDDGQLFLHMGKLLYDMGKPRHAARALERAVRLLPEDAFALYLLGFMYLVIGKEEWAITAWRRSIAADPSATTLRYDLACLLIRRERYDVAAKELQAVLQERPDDLEAVFLLGTCYRELSEPARAIPLFERVIAAQPTHAQALYYLGACYLQTGNAPMGRAYLRRYDRLMARGGRARRLPYQALPGAG